MEVRRLQNAVRARYHKFMRTASAADVALFHSHNDGIRFIAWIFAFIKVGRLSSLALLLPESASGSCELVQQPDREAEPQASILIADGIGASALHLPSSGFQSGAITGIHRHSALRALTPARALNNVRSNETNVCLRTGQSRRKSVWSDLCRRWTRRWRWHEQCLRTRSAVGCCACTFSDLPT